MSLLFTVVPARLGGHQLFGLKVIPGMDEVQCGLRVAAGGVEPEDRVVFADCGVEGVALALAFDEVGGAGQDELGDVAGGLPEYPRELGDGDGHGCSSMLSVKITVPVESSGRQSVLSTVPTCPPGRVTVSGGVLSGSSWKR